MDLFIEKQCCDGLFVKIDELGSNHFENDYFTGIYICSYVFTGINMKPLYLP